MNHKYEPPKSAIGNRKSQIFSLIHPFTHPPIHFFIQNEANSTNAGNKLKAPPKATQLNNQSSIIDNQLKGPISKTSRIEDQESCIENMQNKPNSTSERRETSDERREYAKQTQFNQRATRDEIQVTRICKTNPISPPTNPMPQPKGHDSAEFVEVGSQETSHEKSASTSEI